MELKWKERFSWIDVGADGVHCLYCREGTARGASSSGAEVFLSKPYTGTRPDVLSRHEKSAQHGVCASAYRESLKRRGKKRTLEIPIVRSEGHLTVDGEAICDALRSLYFLAKHRDPAYNYLLKIYYS